ncbi:zinc finger C3H1 domain-containing protein [Danio aesculapii]|uniref:zinc finger C3H1 domain-containing protein n=1 Tax=Danio aesculapii TaxID=1142201 RepID=UPI0024C06D68|nr:zinc finger C3H1 domain-containing protein [Danio aesculapii]
MESNPSCASPQGEELEDGEIFDDEPQQQNARPPRRPRPCRPYRRARLPGPVIGSAAGPPRPPHPAFPCELRQAFESAPRSGFWERSHGALTGRFRYRAQRPQDWPPRDWQQQRFPENHRTDSPGRKPQKSVRAAARRNPPLSKSEPVDESFEDLLLKYKQIQLELECIRKEERAALEDEEPPVHRADGGAAPQESVEEQQQKKSFQAFNIRPLRQKLLTPAERDALNCRAAQENTHALENTQQNTDTQEDTQQKTADTTADDAVKDEDSESDLNISTVSDDTPVVIRKKEDEDEVSELQLRLLALQSASRKWQQKEKQVLKESKEKMESKEKKTEKISSASAERISPRAAERSRAARTPVEKSRPANRAKKPAHLTKQALRKQQLRTWKLKQEAQRQQQEQEEERRRREDEIRRIRDLSNQDEQYNRFMRLVGSRRPSRSKSADSGKLKQSLDTSGCLYQYDNYDEVAMDTDSETNSPAASPTHDALPMFPLESTPHRQVQHGECVRVFAAPPLPPLPPPDEDEPPPKPPFADEEEEEEMLLREELLKSLANRRAPRAEGVSSISGPPSPSLRSAGQSRSNLSTVSLNTVVSHTRALKFIRTHPAPKAPFVLPRHKAVVVRLNASDDSDSEAESCGAAQSVFGGLESMIKEARRTAEAAKPKHSVSEKENNPLKSAEAGADSRKMENRLLRESVCSVDPLRSAALDLLVASPAGSDSELELMSRAVELQDRLVQHRAQLSKDEALLKQLLLQEQKKKESLKAAEGKVLRLKEQLLASEKIVSANRVLLRKLQEQVHRVQHRVSVKQQQAVRMEKGLQQTQAPLKRRAIATVYSPLKRVCVGQSDVQYAELIAQKRRLQQLESEYALKIQKLKEAQALRQADPRPAAPPPPSPAALYPLPQPSLHDLTQDKLALSSGGEEEEQQTPTAEPPTTRRRSFRESGSSTRPKLSPPEPHAVPAAVPVDVPAAAPTLPSAATSAPAGLPELLPGLTVEDLRRRYTRTAGVAELLRDTPTAEHHGKVLQVDFELPRPQSRVELKPEPFGVYHSPLLAFRSYRFSPYFRTKEKLSLRSLSFSNAIEPKKSFCRFDLTGTCNADDCAWQHMRNCTLSESLLFQDILSYCLPLIGCDDSSSASDISTATEKYMKKLFGANKDRMGTDQKAVLLVSKVNERLKHIPPFTTHKAQRRWRPEAQRLKTLPEEEEQLTVGLSAPARHDAAVPDRRCWTDVCVTQDDKRYFDSETDDISNLETSVLENPTHTQLWIKLAYRYLSQRDSSVSECLDAALNTLSRALEDNAEHAELWSHYLTLFTRRASRDELQEMCEMAVEHAPHYSVWWTYVSVESRFEGKDFVAARLVSHLLDAPDLQPDLRSFQLLETLLYRAQLSVFSGRTRSATHTLKIALNSSAASRLTLPHRALLWLSFIHLLELQRLPSSLFDPADSNPSRTVSTEPFLIPWRPAQDTHTPAEQLIQLFTDALARCTDEGLSSAEQIQACFPLHSNFIHLLQHLHRCDEALAQCERLLEVCPLYCPLLEVTAALQPDGAAELWMNTHSQHSTSAHLFYQLSRCLQTQGKLSVLEDLFGRFMRSLCQSVPEQIRPLDVLRHILGVPTDLRAPVLKEDLQEELKDQLPYLHLLHCLWQVVYGNVREAVDAFEKALGAVTQLELIHTLWLDYLSFSRQQVCSPQPSARELKMFSSLVLRCLQTVPVRLLVPFSSAQYWSSYSFHNQVVSFYLGCFPKSQHSLILEKLQHIMPTNTDLAIRLLQQEWQDGNIEHFKLQSRMLCSSFPTCLAIWKM